MSVAVAILMQGTRRMVPRLVSLLRKAVQGLLAPAPARLQIPGLIESTDGRLVAQGPLATAYALQRVDQQFHPAIVMGAGLASRYGAALALSAGQLAVGVPSGRVDETLRAVMVAAGFRHVNGEHQGFAEWYANVRPFEEVVDVEFEEDER